MVEANMQGGTLLFASPFYYNCSTRHSVRSTCQVGSCFLSKEVKE